MLWSEILINMKNYSVSLITKDMYTKNYFIFIYKIGKIQRLKISTVDEG